VGEDLIISRKLDNPRTRAVGVVIPANNEERLLNAALEAVERSLVEILSDGLLMHVAVVLDACRDASARIAHDWEARIDATDLFGVTVVEFDGHNVGRARAVGFEILLEEFRDVDLDRVWFATSDADTRVPPHWISAQLARHELGADAWAGRVVVTEWPRHRRAIAATWQRAYDAEVHPIHGASLGVNAKAYVSVGGFPPLRSSEDRALYYALVALGADVHFDSSAPVVTSARRDARAPAGFAAALTRYDTPVRWA
jgi:hypothetical protein